MITTSTLNDIVLYLYNELEEEKVQKLHSQLNCSISLTEIFDDWVNMIQELDIIEMPTLDGLETKLMEYSLFTKTAQA